MEFFSQHKIPAFIILGLLLAGGAWWGLSSGGESSSLLAAQAVDDTSNIADKALVVTLLQLRAVSLSGSILQDPSFINLRDFGTQIVPEPVGRPNPFAPLSSMQASTTGRAATLFQTKRP